MQENKVTENRAHPRYEVTAYVDVTGHDLLLYHRVQNLSLGGICIESATVEDLGTRVSIVINFPDIDSVVSMTGEVVWVNQEPPKDMGIRWVNLTERQTSALRDYLHRVRKRAQQEPSPAGKHG